MLTSVLLLQASIVVVVLCAVASLKPTIIGHTDGVYALAVLPGGRHFLSGSDDETVKVWDAETFECMVTLTGGREGEGEHAWNVKASSHLNLNVWPIC